MINDRYIINDGHMNDVINELCPAWKTDQSQASMISDGQCIALHFLLTNLGDVCAVANISCCSWINKAAKVKEAICSTTERSYLSV